MNKQFQILTWIYENQENFPLKSGKIFQAYQETEGYDAQQANFSQLLSKLSDKNFIEKVEYGTYDITDKGARKVETFLYEDSEEIVRPENYSDMVDELDRYLLDRKSSDIQGALLNGEAVKISLEDIDRFNSELFEEYFSENPESFVEALEEALARNTDTEEVPDYSIVPDLDWLDIPLNEAITSSNLEGPMIVSGIIRKREQVSKIVTSAVFECVLCGDRYEKEQGKGPLKSPYKCDCGSRKFEVESREIKDVIDFQLSHRDEQETTLDARIIGNPDLEKETQKDLMTGTKVRLLGVPELLENQHKNAEKREIRLEVIDYERSDRKKDISQIDKETKKQVLQRVKASEDPFEDFAMSIAPDLGDMDLPRRVVTASLIGAPEMDRDGSTEYGRIHVGIISNPGTGKSHLQNWVNEKFEKAYQTQGQSGTGTGLTATVEQTKGGEWQLVAGKLVFADRGILQIDEFDKFREGELTSLNTAMESGFFSVDKASVSAELPGRATVIATGNFAGKLDNYQKAYEMLPEKGEGLYDRFALMCAVTDTGSEAQDKIMAKFMDSEELTEQEKELFEVPFTPEELRVYRHLARKYDPGLTQEAVKVLKERLEAPKESDNAEIRGESNRLPTHLIKISMAVARANLNEKVTTEDAEKAIELMNECKQSLDLELSESAKQAVKGYRKQKAVKETVKELSDGSEGAEVEEVLDRVSSDIGIDRREVEDVLKTLKNDGQFYEPESGQVAEL